MGWHDLSLHCEQMVLDASTESGGSEISPGQVGQQLIIDSASHKNVASISSFIALLCSVRISKEWLYFLSVNRFLLLQLVPGSSEIGVIVASYRANESSS